MKKTFVFIVIAVLVMAFAMPVFAEEVDCELNPEDEACIVDEPALEPVVEEPQGNSGSWLCLVPRVTDRNYWVYNYGDTVVVNFLANKFSTGCVLVNGEEYCEEGLWTYHTVTFMVEAPGTYEITPVMYYGFETVYGQTRTIEI